MAKVISVSLKDALKFRPEVRTSDYERYRRIVGVAKSSPKVNRHPIVWQDQPVICTPMWRPEDFRTFCFLTGMICDADPKTRDQARQWYEQFQRKHGAEKCDMMLAELRRRDAEAWFADKEKFKGA